MSDLPVSHGRGGAANINPDPNTYVDGGIVREGPVGDQGDGAYSTGRGGAANIGSPRQGPQHPGKAGDDDVIPETNFREEETEDHHFGRGGGGNVHHHHNQQPHHEGEKKEGFVEKMKQKIGLDKKEGES